MNATKYQTARLADVYLIAADNVVLPGMIMSNEPIAKQTIASLTASFEIANCVFLSFLSFILSSGN